MRRILSAAIIAAAVLAMPAASADKAPAKSASRPAAANAMDPVKGSLHRIHTKTLKLGCNTCHSQEAKDVLFLRGAEIAVSGANPVDRAACLGCHQSPSKPAWYGAVR